MHFLSAYCVKYLPTSLALFVRILIEQLALLNISLNNKDLSIFEQIDPRRHPVTSCK